MLSLFLITFACSGAKITGGSRLLYDQVAYDPPCKKCESPSTQLLYSPTNSGAVTWAVTSPDGDPTKTLGLRFTTGNPATGVGTLRIEPASDEPGAVRPGTLVITALHLDSGVSNMVKVEVSSKICDQCGVGGAGILPGWVFNSSPGACSAPSQKLPTPAPPWIPRNKLPTLKAAAQPGAVAAEPGLAFAAFNLGSSQLGDAAGVLHIFEELPLTGLSTPNCLHYSYSNALTEVIKAPGSSAIKQLRTPATFVDVNTVSAYKYNVNYYQTNLITGVSGGIYTFSGAPSGTVTVENPDTTGATSNSFRITDTYGRVQDYVFTTSGGTNLWTRTSGGGSRVEVHGTSWSGSNKTVRAETRNASGALESLKIDTYTNAAFGVRRLQSIVGDGSEAHTNTYTYWSNGPVKLVTSSSGSWTYSEYDTNERPVSVFSAYGTQTPTNNPALCRMTEYSYDPSVVSGSGDTNYLEFDRPRRTIERLFSNEVRRTYFVALPFEHREIVCVNPGAAWDDASNLVTVTKFVSDTNRFYMQVKSILHPDGTLTLYDYTTNGSSQTITAWVGQPGDASHTNVIDGTKTVGITGHLGQPVSETVSDIASGLVLSSLTHTNYDDANRPRKATFIDGTSMTTDYGCCGPLNITNRDGTVIAHLQDALGRYDRTAYGGITNKHIYDAAGRVLAQLEIGTNGSVITVVTNTYDAAGELLTSRDALGNITSYAESADGLSRTNTAPDLGTRIELHLPDGSLWKVLGTAVHPMRYTNGVESLDGQSRNYRQEIKLDGDGNDTGEWTKTYEDFAGRHYKTVHSDGATSQSFYNLKGQLVKQVDPDGVITLHAYNALGEGVQTALDMDRNGVIDTNGTDRITQRTSVAANVNSRDARISRSYVWATNNSSVSNLVSENITTADGSTSWSISFGLTNRTDTVVGAGGNNYTTNTAPDGSLTVSHTLNGLLQSVTRKDSGGSQLAQTTFTYDAYGRQKTVTDARNGTTTYAYNDAGQVTSVTALAPGTGQSAQTTSYTYDSNGRVTRTQLPDGGGVTNKYSLRGELLTNFGSRVYPVGYAYDAQGRRTNMTTWQNFAARSGAAATTWNYDATSGLLTSKVYADGRGTTNTYTAGHRLLTRTWARGIVTTYHTNVAGQVFATSYSDGTPAVTNYFDRLGRVTNTLDGAGSRFFTYDAAGRLLMETNASGVLANVALLHTYDALGRRTNVSVLTNSSFVIRHSYAYDVAGRLTNAAGGAYSATYDYLANSPLVSQVTFRSNSTTRMTTTKSYDYLNRLLSIGNAPAASGETPINYSYWYNDANQRIRRTDPDGSAWRYDYDKLGQVTGGKHYWTDQTPVAGQQFEYAYDDIGNRVSTKEGGDASGAGLRPASYTANLLNQYTNRTVPAAADISGIAHASATVTVNDQSAYRKGEYFRNELSLNNASAAVWQGVTNRAVLSGTTNTEVGNVFVPQTPEVFSHDADGNLTNDGRFVYTWDAENRLLKAESLASAPTASKRKMEWTFDAKSRCVSKTTSDGSGGGYVVTEDLKFTYDGWNLLAELNATNNAVINSFIWGLDLSGSLQGAGGVGGLLALSTFNAQPSTHFVGYDGNGNVTVLVSATNGAATATYEYDPFGKVLRATGPMALLNPFRFSTKYTDGASGFNYYGYRSYNPVLGRWLSRDPVGILGGRHLYAVLRNQPNQLFDVLGLCTVGQKTNATCEPKVLHYATTPGTEEAIDDLFKLVETANNVAEVAQIVLNGLADGTAGALEAISEWLTGQSIDADAASIAELAKKAADAGHGAWGGWNLWTRIQYKQCECGFLGLGTRWKEHKSDWKQFRTRTSHNNSEFRYELKLNAYADAETACEAHLSEFNK